MKVGDLVRRKTDCEGLWLVTLVDVTGNWFQGQGERDAPGTWMRVSEYHVIHARGCGGKK